jgi:hypothetical protein
MKIIVYNRPICLLRKEMNLILKGLGKLAKEKHCLYVPKSELLRNKRPGQLSDNALLLFKGRDLSDYRLEPSILDCNL